MFDIVQKLTYNVNMEAVKLKDINELMNSIVYDSLKSQRFYEKLRNNITKVRQQKGISQNELSLLINQSASCINKIETGDCIPTLRTLMNICAALEIKADDIIPYEYF